MTTAAEIITEPCPKCGYAVAIETQVCCPECGLAATEIVRPRAYRAQVEADGRKFEWSYVTALIFSVLVTFAVLIGSFAVSSKLMFRSVEVAGFVVILLSSVPALTGFVAAKVALLRVAPELRAAERGIWFKHARLLLAGWWAFPVLVGLEWVGRHVLGAALGGDIRMFLGVAMGFGWMAAAIVTLLWWRSRYHKDRARAGLAAARSPQWGSAAGGVLFVSGVVVGIVTYVLSGMLLYGDA